MSRSRRHRGRYVRGRRAEACREAFWRVVIIYLKHSPQTDGLTDTLYQYLFHRPCFTPEFFFDADVLDVVRRDASQQVKSQNPGLPQRLSIESRVEDPVRLSFG
jgi:hypothetical protein